MIAHITKRLVDSMKPQDGKRTKVYDDTVTGFGVVAYPTGKKAFFLEYGPRGKQRRMSLGQYGGLTVDAARAMAQAKAAEVVAGNDPLDSREERRKMHTYGEWVSEYLEGVRRRKKQPRHDERYLAPSAEARKHGRKRAAGESKPPAAAVAEQWGKRPLDEITRRDVQAAMESMAARGHTTANRWLASVRACFGAAHRDGVISENPAATIKLFREAPPRARVLTDAEFARVVEAFDALADLHVRAAFLLLLDTGARKSEALNARWEDIDLDGGLWRIPSPKAGRPQVVPLGDATVAWLRDVERLGPWLVPGRDGTKARTDLRRAWDQVREAAAVRDVTIHDLRRTFGLHIARKAGLHIASKLLRHSDIRVTERVYVPLGLDAMREAADDMARERGKVIELQRAKAGRGA
ncbi:integrase [Deltaproteobacteria bacterium]|nr:integrase [Deltaproteobacteria bacterium]